MKPTPSDVLPIPVLGHFMSDTITAFLVHDDSGELIAGPTTIGSDQLPDGDVEIDVEWSSLNFKDTLAASGDRRVAGDLPHVPGIDAAGTIRSTGEPVVVTGYGLGAPHWGGWAERIRVPAKWVCPLPAGLSLRESMQLGTAGLTAAMATDALIRRDISPESGPILVTGATGGAGMLSVALLSKLGYNVVAATGKSSETSRLEQLGATRVIDRQEVAANSSGPLASSMWAGAVDVVGGDTLAAIIASMAPRGVIAACGLVGGTDLATTVYPFLLRGVTLAGIDSAGCPQELRQSLWSNLADTWRLEDLDSCTNEVTLHGLAEVMKLMQRGAHVGRTIVRLADV